MSTPLWHDHYITSQPLPPATVEPRHSAPPVMQQPTAESEDVVVWDDSMMDLDDYREVTQPATAVADAQPDAVPAINLEDIRPEAVHIRGVDNLSTDDVKLYITSLFRLPEDQEFKVEWIDDTSLNIVYPSAEIATSAIAAISSNHIESLPPTALRPAKAVMEPKQIDGIKVRIATMGDKKERGARDRSRWYLFNPHPAEEHQRRPCPDYRRDRGRRRYDPYSRGGRSRSPVLELDYDDPPRNTRVELFPQKVSTKSRGDHYQNGHSRSRSRSRSPPRRRIENSHPVFNSMLRTVSSADQPRRPRGGRMEGAPMEVDDMNTIELFPSKLASTKTAAMDSVPPLSDRIGPSNGTTSQTTTSIELFPNKVASRTDTVELFPQKVAATSGKSLLERIQDDEGGRRELFPEKVGGAGRRNRRKAEDHF